MAIQRHTVPDEARGLRLDAFLAQVEPGLSRSRLKALIDAGQVTVDGGQVKPSRLLKGGEAVEIDIPAPRSAAPKPQEIPFDVLYEDSDLIAVDKPAGMVVHPAAGHEDGTLVNALLHRVTDLQGIGGELRPGIVHRLDKETSGCLVVAKSEPVLIALQAQFKQRSVEKEYWALVHGVPAQSGRIETLYGRHPTDRKRFTGKVKVGKPAITEYEVLEQFDGAALVRVQLLTGRTHQIRVHLSEAGHPLLADATYGGRRREAKLPTSSRVRQAAEAIGRQALHARRLALIHPTTGRPLELIAELPADFERALTLLRAP